MAMAVAHLLYIDVGHSTSFSPWHVRQSIACFKHTHLGQFLCVELR